MEYTYTNNNARQQYEYPINNKHNINNKVINMITRIVFFSERKPMKIK